MRHLLDEEQVRKEGVMAVPLIPMNLAKAGSPHNELIRASWNRAFQLGLDPESVEVSEIGSIDVEIDELAMAASKVINATASTLDDTNTWISFANAAGAVTYQWAAKDSFRKALDRVNVVQGAVISESYVGPSGIATALASGQSVVVSGEEHFNPRWHNLVCAASPVIHPMTNKIVGAVNITCLAVEENAHLRIALKTVVNGFQQILASGMRSQQRLLLDAHLKTKHITKAPVITIDSNTMIDEKELESQHFTHSSIRAFIEGLRPDTKKGQLPNGRHVTIVRHRGSEGEDFHSLVFDPLEIYAPEIRREFGTESDATGHLELKLLDRAERDTILATLISLNGNKSLAAEMLGVSRGTLYERIKKYNLSQFS
jgi:transcriptional regulator of acetoin/glycerol metabolism